MSYTKGIAINSITILVADSPHDLANLDLADSADAKRTVCWTKSASDIEPKLTREHRGFDAVRRPKGTQDGNDM